MYAGEMWAAGGDKPAYKISTAFKQSLQNYFTCMKNSFGFPARDGHLSAVKGAHRSSGL
jgi:hypothetical protein